MCDIRLPEWKRKLSELEMNLPDHPRRRELVLKRRMEGLGLKFVAEDNFIPFEHFK